MKQIDELYAQKRSHRMTVGQGRSANLDRVKSWVEATFRSPQDAFPFMPISSEVQ